MKKHIAFVFLFSLVASAAKPLTPTLDLTCTVTESGACSVTAPFSFSGANYRTNRDYLLYATLGAGNPVQFPLTINPDGTLSADGFAGSLGAGTWTITIYNITHGPAKDVASLTVDFE